MLKLFKNIEHQRVVAAVDNESSFTGKFFVLLILSTIIATLGLIANNISVVIGAMIIAPLMWPILGVSLSITRQNQRFLRESIALLAVSIVLSIAVAAIASLLSPILEINGAILERTNPTIIDLVIALATGAVATYIVLTPQSNHLAGVAVAAALIPPLAAAGIALALQDFAATQGAMLLFGANLFAIVFMSIILLTIGGFAKTKKEEEKVNITISLVVSFGLLVIIAAPLGLVLKESIAAQQQESIAFDVLSKEIQNIDESALLSSLVVGRSNPDDNIVKIDATVQAPLGTELFVSDQERIAQKISEKVNQAVTLTIIITPTLTAKTPVTTDQIDINKLVTNITKRHIPNADVLSVTVEETDEHIQIATVAALNAPLSDQQYRQENIEQQLTTALNRNVIFQLNTLTYQTSE